MQQRNPNTRYGPFRDDDSGVRVDYDYSSTARSFEPTSSVQLRMILFPIPNTIGRRRVNTIPLVTFTSDGIVERIRPVTMKNSKNSDYIICQTNRGTYIAYRTPLIPAWVTQLVREIELREE